MTPEPAVRPGAGALGDVTARVADIAAGAGRRDLSDRVAAAHAKLADPRLRVVVVGQLKQGKSRFVNALLNMSVCSVGDDETTAIPTVVSAGQTPSAALVVGGERGSEVVPVPFGELARLTPESPYAGDRPISRLEVAVPSPLLADGLIVVDTPGVGGHGNPFAAMTLGMVATADVVFFVSDASQEFTEPEMRFIEQVTALCPTVAGLLTKTDLYPHWRAIRDADLRHLSAAGVQMPLLPVSSALREHAFAHGDEELNAEAGFAALYDYLRTAFGQAREVSRAAAAADLRVVTEHLALALSGEIAALSDPQTALAARTALEDAQTRAERLRRESARWQQTLNDGIVDLAADIDHDLRDRLRAVTREAESAIDDSDPARDWDRLREWVFEQTGAVLAENFVWANDRARWLAGQVAEHFAQTGDTALPRMNADGIDGLLDTVTGLDDLDVERAGVGQKLLVGMRGSYGGVLMFGLLSTMMGVALINPVSVGAGLLLGSKAYRDEKQHKIVERRGRAKVAVRAFTDDVSFQVGKESRDRLRLIQRILRDHFTAVADQASRSIAGSLAAATSVAELEGTQRQDRLGQVREQLDELGRLRRRLDGAPAEAGMSTHPVTAS